MQRYRPDWVSLLEARQHLVVTGVALYDAESDITLAIRDRKIRLAAPQNKITITTFRGVIVDPLIPAVLSLKRQGQWRLSCPENLSPGDLDFENSGSRKPWLYPGFHGHISAGLRLWFNDLRRVFRLDEADATVEAAFQPRQLAGEETTVAQKSAAAEIDWTNSLPKNARSHADGYVAHIVRLDLSEEDTESVLRRGAPDYRRQPSARSPQKATAANKSRAIKNLTAKFHKNPELRREDAKALRGTFSLGPTQFNDVWRAARKQAGLSPRARAGRPTNTNSR
jgi:hypothetical protein